MIAGKFSSQIEQVLNCSSFMSYLKVSIKCGIIDMMYSENYTVGKCNRVKGIKMSDFLGKKVVEATISSKAELPEEYEFYGYVYNPETETFLDVFGPKVLTNDSGRLQYLLRR